MVRRSSVLLPPVALPLLIAVGALLGPVTAAAAGDPAPDPPTAVRAPAPDPAPAAHSELSAAPRAPVTRAIPMASVAAPRVVVVPAPRRSRVHVKPAVRHVQKRVVRIAAPIVDVPPLQVDVHRGLGAMTPALRDDSPALLAGIALLVAAAVATSALALTLVAARAPRSAT
jgi:hypothetical protein